MYDVRDAFVHPRYASKMKVNDVGLICLYAPLRFSPKILPIRLVSRDHKLPANQAAIVSGWGKLKVRHRYIFLKCNRWISAEDSKMVNNT